MSDRYKYLYNNYGHIFYIHDQILDIHNYTV